MFHSRKTAKNERVLQLVKGLTSLMLQIRVRALTCLVKNRKVLPSAARALSRQTCFFATKLVVTKIMLVAASVLICSVVLCPVCVSLIHTIIFIVFLFSAVSFSNVVHSVMFLRQQRWFISSLVHSVILCAINSICSVIFYMPSLTAVFMCVYVLVCGYVGFCVRVCCQ